MNNIPVLKNNPYHLLEIISLLAGLLVPFSFSPYDYFWLQFPLISILFLLCLQQSPRVVFQRSFLFGFGWFVHGIHWIFYSLYFHGGTPVFLAVLMVVLMASVLALFIALMMYFSSRFINRNQLLTILLVFPLATTLAEWLRGYLLTGFPWLQLGTAQVDSFLAGYAPVIGGLGVGFMVCLVSGLLLCVVSRSLAKFAVPAIVFIFAVGYLLLQVSWTEPQGNPIKVSLIQGNIPQSEKWKRQNYLPTLKMYRDLTHENASSDLIVWPETAIPGFRSRVNSYLDELTEFSRQTDTDILLGLFVKNETSQRYYNSAITVDGQIYKKRHLVPLGEYFPFRPIMDFFSRWINIPMSDLDSGEREQPLITAAGQTLGVNICFEDAFDRDVRRDLPEATVLVNMSNDAWFEDSPEPWQHHQIARMRSLEAGRSMIRVTNTGVSSVIGVRGEVLVVSRQFERQVLQAKVQGYQGATPYVIWGNYLLVSIAIIALALFVRRKS